MGIKSIVGSPLLCNCTRYNRYKTYKIESTVPRKALTYHRQPSKTNQTHSDDIRMHI